MEQDTQAEQKKALPDLNSAGPSRTSSTREIIRRAPAIETKIADLAEGGRVAVTGTVVSKNPEISSFIIDDGENNVQILTNNPNDFTKIKEGQFVRVLGKVWGSGDEVEIQADIVQDFSKIDKDLYKKVFHS